MKKYTIALTMTDRYQDLFTQVEYLKLVNAYKLIISNQFTLPDAKELGVDRTSQLSNNPGHQAGQAMLMNEVDACLREMPPSKWLVNCSVDVYILDWKIIDEITDCMEAEGKKIAAFPWYTSGTLSADFFIVDRQWALDNRILCFFRQLGAEQELWNLVARVTKGGQDQDETDESPILYLEYEVEKDRQEIRARGQGGARNFPWREKYKIVHDHIGEYIPEMKLYGPWTPEIEAAQRKYRNFKS